MVKSASTVKSSARISVNKLGEYLVATATQRRSLIRDQKKPNKASVPYYNEAESSIVEFITGDIDIATLGKVAMKLLRTTPKSTWYESHNANCADAILKFAENKSIDQLLEFDRIKGDNITNKLLYGGVLVSVRPEIILKSVDSSGNVKYGAVKLRFSSKLKLSEKYGKRPVGEYIASTVHQYVEAYLLENGIDGAADPGMCFLIDVFDKKIYRAPKSYKAIRKDLIIACEEIEHQWDYI